MKAKGTIIKYEQLKIKLKDPMRSITNKSDNCDRKYTKSNMIQMMIYF